MAVRTSSSVGVYDNWDEDGVWVGAELEGRGECRFGDMKLTENNEWSGSCSSSASTGGRIPGPGRLLISRTEASHQLASSSRFLPSIITLFAE